jgi:GGDEF domain-containing protein
MITPNGIVFSQDVLATTWFQVLGAAVAFNSLVFLGMTVAKLIPWPQQFHPDWVAERLAVIGVKRNVEEAQSEIRKRQKAQISGTTLSSEADPFNAIRDAIIIRDIPWVISVTGILAGLLSFAEFLFLSGTAEDSVYQFAGAIVYLILGISLGRSSVGATARSWLWVLVAAAEVESLALLASRGVDEVVFTSSLIIMSVYAPLTMRWRPAITGGLVMIVIYAIEALSYGITDIRWFLAGPIAVGSSLILLKLRLITISSLAEERVAMQQVATTDAVTGVLTRRGLMPLIPALAGAAHRVEQPVQVTVLRVDNADQLAEAYSSIYRDELLSAVADAARRRSNLGDLVARWTPDTFLVVGFGSDEAEQEMVDRVLAEIGDLEMTLGKEAPRVSAASASGDPLSETFESLVLTAESLAAPA